MARVRIYLPTTLGMLSARLPALTVAGGTVDPRTAVADAGAVVYAVTPALREWYREGDTEELEYVALTRAARASLQLLAKELATAQGTLVEGRVRRAVLAADVPETGARAASDLDVAAARLAVPLPFSALAALHVDESAVEGEVIQAATALAAALDGDEDARFVVDGLDDHELLWYAVQEIDFVLS